MRASWWTLRAAVLAGLIGLIGLAQAAAACGLEEIARGTCDESTMVAPPDDGLLGAIYLPYAWTQWDGFARIVTPEGRIRLTVCAYQGAVATLSGSRTTDYGDRPADWRRKVENAERVAAVWEEAELAFGAERIESRVDFDFRHADGSLRRCEDAPESLIRIGFNATTNSAPVGTVALETVFAGRPTMRLRNDATTHEIAHEFGHALGFVHEMQHPAWDACRAAFDVRRYLRNRFGIRDDTAQGRWIAANLDIGQLEARHFQRTDAFDRTSIMAYAVPRWFFPRGQEDCALRPDGGLTDDDLSILLDIYGARRD